MSSADKRYHVIFSERAEEMLVQHTRFLAQVRTQAEDKLRTIEVTPNSFGAGEPFFWGES